MSVTGPGDGVPPKEFNSLVSRQTQKMDIYGISSKKKENRARNHRRSSQMASPKMMEFGVLFGWYLVILRSREQYIVLYGVGPRE